ncbi:MAG: hypothetical protein GXY44_04605 [Phycisphaerales bacterium]|nr:hypothetical protein [Phycisphaerales bacterium]
MSHAKTKIARVMAALNHQETDRVPMGEFFWSNFLRRCRKDLGSGPDFDPYRYWDLDLVVLTPNLDPHVRDFRVLEDSDGRTVVQTGFEAVIEVHANCPMPMYRDFATQTFEQMDAFRFDDPADERRYRSNISDQINCVGDTLNRRTRSYVEQVGTYTDDFCVFGGVCEPHEMIWRILGTENVLMKIAEEPARVARFIERLGDFLVGSVQAQIAIAGDKLSGMIVWGDVAYGKGMFFSPDYWRKVYKPQLKRICDVVHAAGLKVLYHGCGNASVVYDDMIEAGVDAYNPLEAKAGLDVVDLKRRFGSRWAFSGNIDVRILAGGDREKIRREVLTKLNAAKGGGYILQSDHSIPDDVAPRDYDYMVQLVREHGSYPLQLGEYDLEI